MEQPTASTTKEDAPTSSLELIGDDLSTSSEVSSIGDETAVIVKPVATDDASQDEVAEVHNMIKRETRDVARWRFIVTVAMLAVAVGITAMSFIFLTNEEQNDFETSFEQYSSTLIETSRFRAETLRKSFSDFGAQVTSVAEASNQTWPYVTIPNLHVLGDRAREQSDAIGFWFSPLLPEEEDAFEGWANYSIASGRPDLAPYPWKRGSDYIPASDFSHPSAPAWQINPTPDSNVFINYNVFSTNGLDSYFDVIKDTKEPVVGSFTPSFLLSRLFPEGMANSKNPNQPYSTFIQPIFDTLEEDKPKEMTGMLSIFILWHLYFENQIPDGVRGIYVHIESTCNKESATWELNGPDAIYMGSFEDLIRNGNATKLYTDYAESSSFDFYKDPEAVRGRGPCLYDLHVYPSQEFLDTYKTNRPLVLTVAIGCAFLFMILAFFAYDRFQRQRTAKVVASSARTNAFVGSMFPSNIRDRLLAANTSSADSATVTTATPSMAASGFMSNKGHLKNFLHGDRKGEPGGMLKSKPIADFFPEVTIMFCDITGFTAWSSVREPPQVFQLLETLYANMDKIAKRFGVFKVETVGDCYVAVSGLPEPRKDHALLMARFSRVCLTRSIALVQTLETRLGPDTGDLNFRVGLHSGPVTAGVLRGERARFQLFGDTVNTASRIEETGTKGRIHVSMDTAKLLMGAGKAHWMVARQEPIRAKGKGRITTYWLHMQAKRQSVASSVPNEMLLGDEGVVIGEKTQRLIQWHVDCFSRLLKQIVARRNAKSNKIRRSAEDLSAREAAYKEFSGKSSLDEVKEIIALPAFDARTAKKQENPESIELSPDVMHQLTDYVTTISQMYPENHFHNFEHASHVAMSVIKLLSRIVAPSDLAIKEEEMEGDNDEEKLKKKVALALHDNTYGITSDPLTQFAVVFSALIHDVDHSGVPNSQLIAENPKLAAIYESKSVAEQNSIDLSWDLLIHSGSHYKDLCHTIYESPEELAHFRQLVVQTVLATDIADKELKTLRNARWENAFHRPAGKQDENPRDTINRKATIVIEHLIQASDIAHTMQHWHVYRKWNERFFRECYAAYKEGRAEKDPSEGWYNGEIGFFDFYIIPLAKKLKDCGVFGVSSDEYLNYAEKNRQEWEECGEDVVREMLATIRKEEEIVQMAPMVEGDVEAI